MTMADFRYGGQAVMEGVMMRGQRHVVTAVRRPDGEIVYATDELHPIFTGRLRKTPFMRGVFALIEALGLGIKSLMFSASVALGEEAEDKSSAWYLWGMVAISMVFSVGFFFMVPLVIARALPIAETDALFSIVEGVVRTVIFIIYLSLISLMPDIRRVFAYHGAEHKAINAHEAGETLTVATAANYSRAHTRCGTSFLFVVLVIAIIVFTAVGQWQWVSGLGYLVLSRIVLLPLIAGISYEIIYFSARHCANPVVRAVMAPGLALQSLTTREPDESQLEVSLASLAKLFELEGAVPVECGAPVLKGAAAQAESGKSSAESGV